MDTRERLEYRKQLIDDAVRMKDPDRVPHTSNFALWPILDYGAKLSEACRDWALMEKVYRHFFESYQFDCSGNVGGFLCNPPKMLDRIGAGYNIFNDEDDTVSLEDFDLLQPDEYDDLIDDFYGLVWNKLLPRKFERWGSVTVGDFKAAIDEYVTYGAFMERMQKIVVEEYGVPGSSSAMLAMPGIEQLFNTLRGIKGTARDMRKVPDKVKRLAEHTNPGADALYEQLMQAKPSNTGAYSAWTGMLASNFVSLSQFDEYFWPYLKAVIDAVVKADATVYIFAEGVFSRFYDYFRDVPAGHVAVHIEQDDVFDFKANLPNICVVGGMPTQLLGGGTAKQCVDYAKHLCDELGPGGGFILSQDKMMSYMRDCKPENLKAVCDFVQDYRI
jgi:hypothetical protein